MEDALDGILIGCLLVVVLVVGKWLITDQDDGEEVEDPR